MTAGTPPAQSDVATTERRLVSAVFADVVDSTSLAERMDPEDWSAVMRRVIALMTGAAERNGGSVIRVMGDGLLAIFGAPVAHEDDAIRAVHAGLEMVAAVVDAGPSLRRDTGEALQVRVGINTGLAIIEGLAAGSAPRDAMGDAVNVAARMQAAARPGTVLVTGETWRYASPAFDAVGLGGLNVKGKAEPVEAWEVQGRRDEPGSGRGLAGLTSPLVGREEPLQQLAALLGAVRAGRGRAALILGEAGVGKSRLLAELRALDRAAPDAGSRWAEARSASYGVDVPFGLLSDLVLACLGMPRRASPESMLGTLSTRVGEAGDERLNQQLPALAHLLSLPVADAGAADLSRLGPEALRERYIAAIDVLLRTLATDRPLAIVADDIHWADASSIDVLSRLLPMVNELPLLLVIAGRPDRGTAGWRLVEAARATLGEGLSEVVLIPLDETDSRALVANLLEVESLPLRLRDFIVERADGNPFFVEEVIRMLIERGWVVLRNGRWVGSDTIAAAEVPPTLQGLLTARIDRLPDDSRRILRVAAVIGRDVPVRLLETIVGDAGATARALGQAEAAGLLRIASVDAEPVFRFRHVLVQEAAYESLLKADRRRLHREVGEAIEAGLPGRGDELAPILGLHFERAGETERAVAYLEIAGRAAYRRFAVREARDLLDRAAALLASLPEDQATERRRIEIDLLRAAAGVTFIPYDQELARLVDTRARAERLADPRLLGLVLARAAHLRHLQEGAGDAEAFEADLEGALKIGHELGDPYILGRPLAIKGVTLAARGRRRDAVSVLEEALKQLEPIDPADAAFYAGQLGVINAELGDFAAARRAAERSHALAELSGDPNMLADADIFDGMALAMEGRRDEALTLAERGATSAAAVGNLGCEAVGSLVAGEQELALGKFGPAIAWLEKANGIAAYCSAVDVERLSAATLIAARAMAGEDADGLDGVDPLLEQARAAHDPLGEARILMRRAEAHATVPNGDRDQARSDVEACMTILREIETAPYLEEAERLAGSLREPA
jgi:class 3 adenylate cyclase/tetratricopeptide (TPR) repeat protein